ncbi:MAG TPA: tail fiber protein [Saprospiraceae bacterium]|nr:tail fiber protein [Saprospiraceae bacterium]HPN70758.1 tail fiber protein [Saprospiraceae bacterium]
MSDQYLSQINIFSFGFAPKGWALCNGQLLPINQNQALFSLLGTTFGGDGRVNFGLPDLRSRVPMHFGGNFTLGQRGGSEAVTLSIPEMPAHTHIATGSSNAPNTGTPANNFWSSNTSYKPYNATPNETMSPQAISTVGGSQPHNNISPISTLNFCIALQGIFPSQN